jgi:hypothetical protein
MHLQPFEAPLQGIHHHSSGFEQAQSLQHMTHNMTMKHVLACTEAQEYGYLAIKHCLILYATKDDASCPCPVIVMNLLHLPFLQCTTFCLDLKLSATRMWRYPYLQHCLQAHPITDGTESTCEERNRSRLGENKMHVAQTLNLVRHSHPHAL